MKLKLTNRRKLVICVILILAVIGGAIGYMVQRSGKKSKIVMETPQVSQIETGEIQQRITASGTVQAADPKSIFIEVSQKVSEVYADIGDEVKEGDLLVSYDIEETQREYENKVKSSQIELENAQNTLEQLVSPATGSELIDLKNAVASASKNLSDAENEITSLDNKIEQANADMETAKRTMEQNQELLAVGGVTEVTYTDSVTAYETAVDAYEEAKTNKQSKEESIESLKLSLEKAQIELQTGQDKLSDSDNYYSYQKQLNTIEECKTNLETAQFNLSKLTKETYSPVTGTIIENNAVAGQYLTDATEIMQVADLTNLDVLAYVSEYDIAKIQVGQQVEMTSDGIENKVYHGTVTQIEPTASEQSTISGSEVVVPILVHMEDNDALVKPGFNFDLEIIVVDLPETTKYLPISSVLKDAETGETYVYTVDEGNQLLKTPVELGVYSDMYVELLGGLEENSRIVTSPEDSMKEGDNLMDYAKTKAVSAEEAGEMDGGLLDSVMGGSGGGMPGGGRSGGGPGGPR